MEQQYIGIALIAALVGMVVWNQAGKARTAKKVKTAIEEGALVVDVRTPGEYGSGRYPNAINIPLDAIDRKSGKLGSKDRVIVVYCASGSRSAQAAMILRRMGFLGVLNGGALSSMPQP